MKQEIIDNIRKNLIIIGQCCRCVEHLVVSDPFFLTADGQLVDTYCAEVETEELYTPKIIRDVQCLQCLHKWNAIMPDFVQVLECPGCGEPVLLTKV